MKFWYTQTYKEMCLQYFVQTANENEMKQNKTFAIKEIK